MPEPLYLGLDLGTSGARAVVIDAPGQLRAEGKAAMADFGTNHRAPDIWWRAAEAAVDQALSGVEASAVAALSVDGTSGTMLPIDAEGRPLADGLMYNDACQDAAILGRIADAAPGDSPARGATSGLARALSFAPLKPAKVVHQADWIAGRFSGRWVSDENDALKTGYDLDAAAWPDWIAKTGLDPALLPEVFEPGQPVGTVTPTAAARFGFSPETRVVAGTTDGCASFLATGADTPGDGVSALGTTLTIKLLSDVPVRAPHYGIYSHRLLGNWLVGGASNTGGNVLLTFFHPDELKTLSARIDAETDSGLDYYPLSRAGERFPINDPDLKPRLEPRPEDDAVFLQGLFEGIAAVEALAYSRLQDLGAPKLTSVRTVGGGAANAVWSRIRARKLGVPLREPASAEAAYGAALLARRGAG